MKNGYGARYTDEQRLNAVNDYRTHGNYVATARKHRMSAETLRRYVKQFTPVHPPQTLLTKEVPHLDRDLSVTVLQMKEENIKLKILVAELVMKEHTH